MTAELMYVMSFRDYAVENAQIVHWLGYRGERSRNQRFRCGAGLFRIVAKRVGAAALGSAAIVVLVVAGCSSQKETGGVGHGSGANHSATLAGASLVVDGRARQMQRVECVTAANWMMANVGTDQDGIAVTTTAGDSPTVDSLVLGSFDGVPFGWHKTDNTSAPTVTKSGQTYKIVGTAIGPSPSGTGTLSKPFELDFTCPRR